MLLLTSLIFPIVLSSSLCGSPMGLPTASGLNLPLLHLQMLSFHFWPFEDVLIIYFMCIRFAWVYIWVPLVCLVPTEAGRGHGILWTCNYRWLWAAVWALGIKPWPSAKAANVLSYLAISSAPPFISWQKYYFIGAQMCFLIISNSYTTFASHSRIFFLPSLNI